MPDIPCPVTAALRKSESPPIFTVWLVTRRVSVVFPELSSPPDPESPDGVWGDETVIGSEVPVIPGLPISVAESVCDPRVRRVAENEPVPEARAESAGNVAALSVPMKCTIPA